MKVKILTEGAVAPIAKTDGSAGFDLALPSNMEPVVVESGESQAFRLGFATSFDKTVAMLVYPRSGLSTQYGIVLANTAAVIDSDYRGEWILVLKNTGNCPYTFLPKERVAQAVPHYRVPMSIELVSELDATVRGEGGFGSTGGV